MFFSIEEFSGFYEISKSGVVISLARNGTVGKDREVKATVGTNGYLKVSLRCNGVRFTRNIHRLLAVTFIPNPNNLPCVNHIDGDKLNNKLENLEWVSYAKNIKHAYDNGLTVAAKGEARSILKNEDVLEIVKLKNSGFTLKTIAEKFNISASTVSDIVNGRTWRHITNISFNPNSFKGKKSSTMEKGITISHNGNYDVFTFIDGKNKYLIRLNSLEKAKDAKNMADNLLSDGVEIKQVVAALRSVFSTK